MSPATIITIVTVALAVGLGLGIFGTLMLVKHDLDSERLDRVELFNWQIGSLDGRWAVLRKIDGRLFVIGQTHESLRGAIDGVPTNG